MANKRKRRSIRSTDERVISSDPATVARLLADQHLRELDYTDRQYSYQRPRRRPCTAAGGRADRPYPGGLPSLGKRYS